MVVFRFVAGSNSVASSGLVNVFFVLWNPSLFKYSGRAMIPSPLTSFAGISKERNRKWEEDREAAGGRGSSRKSPAAGGLKMT